MKIGQDIKWLLSLRTSGVPGDRGNGKPKKTTNTSTRPSSCLKHGKIKLEQNEKQTVTSTDFI
jgi:hypothetical protein